jgi:nucleotide sugar dehydrogenase
VSAAVRESQVVVLLVPVTLDERMEPDYTALEKVIQEVGEGLKQGTLVVYEGTLKLGDTRKKLGPALQRASGLRMGEDFALAFSPQRCHAGHVFSDLRFSPKIVAGVNKSSQEKAIAFYQQVIESLAVPAATLETAELVPLMEAAVRDVNVALANEFALLAEAHGIDMREALTLANTQPYFPIRSPGLGLDSIEVLTGACLLRGQGGSRLVSLAREIDDSMVAHGVARLAEKLGGLQGREVAIMADEKSECAPTSQSPASRFLAALRKTGASARVRSTRSSS